MPLGGIFGGANDVGSGIRFRTLIELLSRSADEVPFAPWERFMQRYEVNAGEILDEGGLTQPLRIGANFVFGHRRKGIHFCREPAHHRNPGNEVDESEKGGPPRLHEQDAAVL